MTLFVVILVGLLLVVVGLVVYGISIYNGLVAVKHQVEQAWSNIDVLLRQRHDELPKLIDVVKGYGAYERDVLEKVTMLRARQSGGVRMRRGSRRKTSFHTRSPAFSRPRRPIPI